MEHPGRVSPAGLRGHRAGWSLRSDRGRCQTERGDPLVDAGRAAASIRPGGIPTRAPHPERPPFQGGMIGFLGYDLAPLIERLPRKAPRDSRLPDLHRPLRHRGHGRPRHGSGRALGATTCSTRGRAAVAAAAATGEQRPELGCESDSSADRAWDRLRAATSAGRTISPPSAGRSNTSRPATSSRSTSRSGSTATGRSTRSTSTSGSATAQPRAVRGVSALGRPGGRLAPARSGSTRPGATGS